jgi:hypothetical protein
MKRFQQLIDDSSSLRNCQKNKLYSRQMLGRDQGKGGTTKGPPTKESFFLHPCLHPHSAVRASRVSIHAAFKPQLCSTYHQDSHKPLIRKDQRLFVCRFPIRCRTRVVHIAKNLLTKSRHVQPVLFHCLFSNIDAYSGASIREAQCYEPFAQLPSP